MRQHFQKQIERNRAEGVIGLQPEGIPSLVEKRVKHGWNREATQQYYENRIGQCLVFFMLQNASGTKSEILKLFEGDIEDFFDDSFKFHLYYGTLPRIIATKTSSIRKAFPDHLLVKH